MGLFRKKEHRNSFKLRDGEYFIENFGFGYTYITHNDKIVLCFHWNSPYVDIMIDDNNGKDALDAIWKANLNMLEGLKELNLIKYHHFDTPDFDSKIMHLIFI